MYYITCYYSTPARIKALASSRSGSCQNELHEELSLPMFRRFCRVFMPESIANKGDYNYYITSYYVIAITWT